MYRTLRPLANIVFPTKLSGRNATTAPSPLFFAAVSQSIRRCPPSRNMSEGNKTLFEKIVDREIPATFLYEDEESMAIKDINPQAPVHFLVIPKKCTPKLEQMEDAELMGRLMMVANKVAKDQGLVKGYRVVINNGDEGGQEVPHLHIHVIGGKQLKWPPC